MSTRATTVEPKASAPSIAPKRASSVPTVVFEPRRPGLVNACREFWRYRHLVPYFGRMFIAKRYTRTFLGWLWLPLRPGANLAARILVFGGLLGVTTGVRAPYPLFFLVATSAWQLFAESAYWSMRSVELNRPVLREVYVPRLVPILAAAIPSFLEWLVYVGFVMAGMLWYLIRPPHTFYFDLGLRTLLVPAGFACMIVFGLGVGLLASGMSARARDVRFTFSFLLGFLYFMTPVIYPMSKVPPHWRPLAEINPLTGAMEMVKDGLFATQSLSPAAALVTVVAALVVWVPGLWLFDRLEVAAIDRT